MKLADVIDLEAQLALDRSAEGTALHARERALYLEQLAGVEGAQSLLLGWLAALRRRNGVPDLGRRVVFGQRVLGYGLACLGFIAGWTTADVLLYFEEGGPPVNLGHFLLTVVFGQLGLLALLLVGLGARRLWSNAPELGQVARLLRLLARHMERWLPQRNGKPLSQARKEAVAAAYGRVRSRAWLHAPIERYHLLVYGQWFGVLFNLGLLFSCLRLILLSDLAFAWSTSVTALDAELVHRLCSWLALPFAPWFPDAVPSLGLVQGTQYFRLAGQFAGAEPGVKGDPALVGQWWRFVLACTVTYGLLPRLALLGYFQWCLRRAERSVALDTPEVLRVLRHLTTPVLSSAARVPEATQPVQVPTAEDAVAEDAVAVNAVDAVSGPRVSRSPASRLSPGPVSLVPQGEQPSPAAAAHVDVAPAVDLILYRDIPTAPEVMGRALQGQLGLQVAACHRAGGLDARHDRDLRAALAEQGRALAVVVEAWEAPDQALCDFLMDLRETLGPRVPLWLVLVGEAASQGFSAANAAQVEIFRDRLAQLADPYLAVEVLRAYAPEPASAEHVS